jgi:ferredoxin
MSADLNDQGFSYPEVGDPNRCTACGLCFRMCPDCAIQVDKQDVKSSEKK